MRTYLTLAFGLITLAFFVGCVDATKKAEEAGKAVENAAEETGKAVEEAAETAGDVAEDAASKTGEMVEETGKKAGEVVEDTAAAGLAAGKELREGLEDFFGATKETLGKVTDVESAKAALPKLSDLEAKLDSLTAKVEKLPEGAKEAVKDVAAKGHEELKKLGEKINALPGVSDVIKPKLDALMAKLSKLT